jgi:NAD(P)-dependent dehydrogenase (short-subunit alcohol dehydrogenase family)
LSSFYLKYPGSFEFTRQSYYNPPQSMAGFSWPRACNTFIEERVGDTLHSVKDKAVLITGAGRGIGKRLAIGFAAEGARVGLLARSKAELDLTRLEIEHAGGAALRLRADVRDFEQMVAAVERMRAHFGGVDVLMCAAAIQGQLGPVLDVPPKAWVEVIETNLFGVLHSCRAVLPQMVQRRSGKIIILAGGGAATPRPNFSAYAASKTGVVRLAETLAEEVREHNIQVNCLGPGGTYTHMTDEILAAGDRAGWKDSEEAVRVRLTGGVPPEKQMQLALFLASDRSNHVSGKLIHVNDDWRRLETGTIHPEIYTLRRVQKV